MSSSRVLSVILTAERLLHFQPRRNKDSTVVATILKAVEEGKIATFYVTPGLYAEVMRRHWTAQRVEASGIKPISEEEIARIKSGLSVEVSGYSNHLECPNCGHVYGMYEFLAQGKEEHGGEMVEAVFSLKDMAIVRVNPTQTPRCPNCRLDRVTGVHYYICRQYGCCYPL